MKVFSDSLPFFKGNLHTHTTDSDGRLSPLEVIGRYRAEGYDFLALTDHWHACQTRWEDGLLVLSGIECDAMWPTQAVHVIGLGMSDGFSLKRGTDMGACIQAILAAGGRAVLAHPAWSLNTMEALETYPGLTLTEIKNTVSSPPWNGARSDAAYFADMAAMHGRLLPLLGVDDAHFYNGDACQSFIRLQTEALSAQSILEALDAGRFYASEGPSFTQVELTEAEFILTCSPVSTAIVYSNLPYVRERCTMGEGMTEIRYPIQRARGESFVRAEIVDDAGRRAWTNPLRIG